MTDFATWSGIFPASLTMFDRDGALDAQATAEHLEWLVEQGAHGVVVAGTSGEFVGLTDDERVRLVEVAVEAVGDRVPVIAGTGSYGTAHTIELTRAAAAAGAAGAIVILPYYQRPARHEVVEHFRAVGAATDLPIMLYNNPTNSGTVALEADEIGDLYEQGSLHAVKSTFPTVHQVHEVRAATDDGFRVFYGSFMAPLEGMAGGAHGWISGILNVATADAVEMLQAVGRGDLAAARAAWTRILPIKYLYTRNPFGGVSDLAIYRAILELRGRHGGHCRPPLLPLVPEQRDLLEQLLGEPQTV